jgi:hypothetical protein
MQLTEQKRNNKLKTILFAKDEKKENLWLYHFLFVVVPQKKAFIFFTI